MTSNRELSESGYRHEVLKSAWIQFSSILPSELISKDEIFSIVLPCPVEVFGDKVDKVV